MTIHTVVVSKIPECESYLRISFNGNYAVCEHRHLKYFSCHLPGAHFYIG